MFSWRSSSDTREVDLPENREFELAIGVRVVLPSGDTRKLQAGEKIEAKPVRYAILTDRNRADLLRRFKRCGTFQGVENSHGATVASLPGEFARRVEKPGTTMLSVLIES